MKNRSLTEAVSIYKKSHSQEDYLQLLLSIATDVKNGETVSVIVEMNIEFIKKHDAFMPGMVQGTNDKEYLVLCTKEEDYAKYNLCTAEVRLERMLEMLVSDETMGGLCFDLWGKGDCIVPRDHIMHLVKNGEIVFKTIK